MCTEDERGEWDKAWRNRPLRRLNYTVQIDVSPMANHTFGEVTHVDIAADPVQYVDSVWRKDDLCPVCGTATEDESRIGVTIYPYFESGFAYGLPAWAHETCFAECREIDGPAPLPW